MSSNNNKKNIFEELLKRSTLKIKGEADYLILEITPEVTLAKYQNKISGFFSEIICKQNIFGDFTGIICINDVPLILQALVKFDNPSIEIKKGTKNVFWSSTFSLQIKEGRVRANMQLSNIELIKDIKTPSKFSTMMEIPLNNEVVDNFLKYSSLLSKENELFTITTKDDFCIYFGESLKDSKNNIKFELDGVKVLVNPQDDELFYSIKVLQEILKLNNCLESSLLISPESVMTLQTEDETFNTKYLIINNLRK